MCGRVTEHITPADWEALFGIPKPPVEPRYNIPPRERVAILRLARDGRRESLLAHWGLEPRLFEGRTGKSLSMFNARAETVITSPAYGQAFRARRALIPVSGVLEWRVENGEKRPYLIRRRDSKPLVMAGLYEERDTPEGTRTTCTVITTDARGIVQDLHDRMPVLLLSNAWDAWMDAGTPRPDAQRLLYTPYPDGVLEAYPVNPRIGNVRNQGEDLIRRAG